MRMIDKLAAKVYMRLRWTEIWVLSIRVICAIEVSMQKFLWVRPWFHEFLWISVVKLEMTGFAHNCDRIVDSCVGHRGTWGGSEWSRKTERQHRWTKEWDGNQTAQKLFLSEILRLSVHKNSWSGRADWSCMYTVGIKLWGWDYPVTVMSIISYAQRKLNNSSLCVMLVFVHVRWKNRQTNAFWLSWLMWWKLNWFNT